MDASVDAEEKRLMISIPDLVKNWETCFLCSASILDCPIDVVTDSGTISLGPNDPDPPDFWEEGIVFCKQCGEPCEVIRIT